MAVVQYSLLGRECRSAATLSRVVPGSLALRLPVRLARRAGFAREKTTRCCGRAGSCSRHGVSVVLGEYLDQFVDFVPLLDEIGMPYVVQGHGIDLSAALRRPGMAERFAVYHSARAILTRCEYHRQRLIESWPPRGENSCESGGVDVLDLLPRRGPDAAKRFLAIGRMIPKKGPIYLLDAFRLAAAPRIQTSRSTMSGRGSCYPPYVSSWMPSTLGRAYACTGQHRKTSSAACSLSAVYSSSIA